MRSHPSVTQRAVASIRYPSPPRASDIPLCDSNDAGRVLCAAAAAAAAAAAVVVGAVAGPYSAPATDVDAGAAGAGAGAGGAGAGGGRKAVEGGDEAHGKVLIITIIVYLIFIILIPMNVLKQKVH